MGWLFGSSEENDIDTKGAITNNVSIADTVQVHNDHVVWILYLIAVIKCIEILYILFKAHNKNSKKKYIKRGMSLQNINTI